MKYTSQFLPDKFIQLGLRLFGFDRFEYTDQQIIDMTIKRFKEYFMGVGMHENLAALGIKEDKKLFKEMGLKVTNNDKDTVGHYKPLNSDDVANIIEIAVNQTLN